MKTKASETIAITIRPPSHHQSRARAGTFSAHA